MQEHLCSWGLEDVSLREVEILVGVSLPTQFYRVIGPEERQELLNGNRVTGKRYQNDDSLDITTDPNYNRISRSEKFLVTFKQSPRLQLKDGSLNEKSVRTHDVDQNEYYLHGGYTMDDVQSMMPINLDK